MGRVNLRLRSSGLEPWIEPAGGMFVWASLPSGLLAKEVAREALNVGLVLAPGEVFSADGKASRYLRFNVAQCTSPEVFDLLDSTLERVAGQQ